MFYLYSYIRLQTYIFYLTQAMNRSQLLSRIILVIKQLKDEAKQVFNPENILPNSEYLIEEFFQQKFTPYLEKVKEEIRQLPQDEYVAVELDAWVKVLRSKLSEIDSGKYKEEYAEVLYIKRRFYPLLIDTLKELELEVLEKEFDAKADQDENIQYGEHTVLLSVDVIAASIALLYNFNIISPNNSLENICKHFASLTGYSWEELFRIVELDRQNGRLRAKVNRSELKILLKLLHSMTSRTEYALSYEE